MTKKINKTLIALIILYEMGGVKDGQYLQFAEKLWKEEYPHLFTKVYGTNTGVCKGKGPRFMAGSFLAKLKRKGLTGHTFERFGRDNVVNIRIITSEGIDYIKNNIFGNLSENYIKILEYTLEADNIFTFENIEKLDLNNINYKRVSLLKQCGFMKKIENNCSGEFTYSVTEKGTLELEKYKLKKPS